MWLETDSFPLRTGGRHHCFYIKCQTSWNYSSFDFNFMPSQRCTHKKTSLFHLSKWDEWLRFNSNLVNEWTDLYYINICKTHSFSSWPVTSPHGYWHITSHILTLSMITQMTNKMYLKGKCIILNNQHKEKKRSVYEKQLSKWETWQI